MTTATVSEHVTNARRNLNNMLETLDPDCPQHVDIIDIALSTQHNIQMALAELERDPAT